MRLLTISGVLIFLFVGGRRVLSGQQGVDPATEPLELGLRVPVEILKDGEVPAIQEVLVNP